MAAAAAAVAQTRAAVALRTAGQARAAIRNNVICFFLRTRTTKTRKMCRSRRFTVRLRGLAHQCFCLPLPHSKTQGQVDEDGKGKRPLGRQNPFFFGWWNPMIITFYSHTAKKRGPCIPRCQQNKKKPQTHKKSWTLLFISRRLGFRCVVFPGHHTGSPRCCPGPGGCTHSP